MAAKAQSAPVKFSKKKRVLDEELLATVRMLPCLVCRTKQMDQEFPTEADHVTTRGAGGSDTPENVWPLCTLHHKERHDRGLPTIIRRYPVLATWLELAGRQDILSRLNR